MGRIRLSFRNPLEIALTSCRITLGKSAEVLLGYIQIQNELKPGKCLFWQDYPALFASKAKINFFEIFANRAALEFEGA